MAKTKLCKYCRSQIDKKASICPHCQKKQSGIGDAFKAVIVAIALIIFVPAFIGACSKSSSKTKSPSETSVEVLTTAEKKVSIETGKTDSTKNTEAETTASSTETETVAEVTEEETTEAAVSENIVVYEQNGVKISYTGIEEKTGRILVKFLIENDTDIDYCVQERDFSANGYMLDANMSAEVAPHKKCNDGITVYKSTLEENNITDIENIEFYFHIFDWDNWTNGIDSDVISINIK